MEQHDFQQGTPEWHAHRRTHFNASDAPAMLGISKYKSRTQLLDELSTGIAPEIDEATQRRFDDGHRFEALARPLAEKIIGKPLYPVIGSEGKLSASFDGLTSDDKFNFEHKTLNDDLRAMFDHGDATGIYALDDMYLSQIEQQGMVSDCERTLFMASKWKQNDSGEWELVEARHCWVERNHEMRQRLMQGWTQFAIDLENHQHVETAPEAVGKAPEQLPALRIEVTGMVTASNLIEFKSHALAVIGAVKTDLQTDQDFADADKAVKWCGEVEQRLDAAKQHALSQTSSIDELFRTIDEIKEEARQKRLSLEKLVKGRKESIRIEKVQQATHKFVDHIASLQAGIQGINLILLVKQPDFAGAIKGLKTISSINEKLNNALANAIMDTDQIAKDIRAKLEWCKESAAGYSALFPDLQQIIAKPMEDFKLTIASRIEAHKKAEAEKLEAAKQRIEAEAKAKAEREAAAKLAEEEARIRAEERAKAESDQRAKSAEATHGEGKRDPSPLAPAPSSPPIAKSWRPADDEIIEVLVLHFRVHESKVIEWLLDMNFEEYSKSLAAEFEQKAA